MVRYLCWAASAGAAHFDTAEASSADQKKKVLPARSICEPMNYIDVISHMQIEAVLRKYQPTT